MKKKNRFLTGFTLIELMIVVAIIGILAAVAIPKFTNLVAKSRESSVKGKLGALRSALNIYYSDNQMYPATLTQSLPIGQRYISDLPTLRIPAVPGNPGHNDISGEVAVLDDMAGGAWFYLPNGDTAALQINCSHGDSRAVSWTAY